jgi:hypothetical protein
MSGDPRLTRRAVLLGAVATLLTGCRPKRRTSRPRTATPDHAALTAALAAEQALLAEYDARIGPGGTPPDETVVAARAAHAEHVRALGGQVVARTTSPSPSTPAEPTADLTRLEQQSAETLRNAARSARSGAVAALLASIAASHGVFARTRQVGAG